MASTYKIVNGQGIVTLESDLTVRHAGAIKKVLVNALKEAEQVLLDAKRVTSADLAGLQLLCSAHRTATIQGKQLSYDGAVPEVVGKAVEEAGFSRPIGCSLDRTKSCIWVLR